MIPREEIEFTKAIADKGHRCEMPAETVAVLCRVYLAWVDAPVAEAHYDGGADVYLIFEGGPEEMKGCRWNAHMGERVDLKRVRLVLEGEDGH